MSTQELCRCKGANGSIILYNDRLEIKHGGTTHLHDIPLAQIRAVLVERKRVIPFAAITVLALAVTILVKYNPIWFVANLSDEDSTKVSIFAFAVAMASLIPVALRSTFVSVSIRSEGEPGLVRLRFVPVRSAKRLAKGFRELSARG